MRDISNMGSNYFKHWLWMFEQDGKMPCMQLKMYAKYTQLALMYSPLKVPPLKLHKSDK